MSKSNRSTKKKPKKDTNVVAVQMQQRNPVTNENQNQSHNVIKESQGPNTKR